MGEQATTIPAFLEKISRMRTEEGNAYAAAFVPRPDDVLIATFAKAGTTWMQQIVHGLRTGGDMDFSEITAVVPWIEMAHVMGIDLSGEHKGSPRAFKTHWNWHDVSKGCRYICIIRDPRDTAVSFYNFMDGWFLERGSVALDDFVRDFSCQPYFEGGYWTHLLSWWEQRNNPDVLFLTFEDMKADHAGVVHRVVDFLGPDLPPEVIDLAIQQSTFAFMKEHERHFDDHLIAKAINTAVGLPADVGSSKVKSGNIGDHKHLSEESIALLDALWAEHIESALGFASYDDLRAAI